MKQILPVLDVDALQKAANEFAMKGATESLKEFYSGYNSPYRKAIDEELKNKGISFAAELPDIIAVLNESLSAQIDAIANEAIAKTYVPLVRKFLTRAEPELKLSDILKEFIEVNDLKSPDDCELDLDKSSPHGWINMKLSFEGKTYGICLHSCYETEKLPVKKYHILSLPSDMSYNTYPNQKMILTVDGGKLEMPFTRDILTDRFTSFIARLVIAGTKITIDCEEFEYDMFPERCHCD